MFKNILTYPKPRGIGRWSGTTRLLGLRVRIPPAATMFTSCESYVLCS